MSLKKKSLFIDFNWIDYSDILIESAKNLSKQLNLGNRILERKMAFLICLLLNLKKGLLYGRNIIIPQDKEFYRKNNRNSIPIYQTYHIVVNTIKELERKGYIKNHGFVIKHATSSYFPEKKLLPYLDGFGISAGETRPPTKYVILRELADEVVDYETADKYIDIDYRPTQLTQKMTQDLKFYNRLREVSDISLKNLPSELFHKHIDEFLSRWSVDNLEELRDSQRKSISVRLKKSYLVRIFNRNFRRGGRFYRGVESNMPEELRKHIYINGNPTVELDYSGHHLRMLYHLKGVNLKSDPYAVERNMTPGMREVYKAVSLIGINARDNTQALRALWSKFEDDNLTQYLPDNEKNTRQLLINNFKAHNTKISGYLFKQKCHMLMNIDSKISNDILVYFAKKDILVLCIHDSYIIENQHAKELLKVMRKAYRAALGFYPVIK